MKKAEITQQIKEIEDSLKHFCNISYIVQGLPSQVKDAGLESNLLKFFCQKGVGRNQNI